MSASSLLRRTVIKNTNLAIEANSPSPHEPHAHPNNNGSSSSSTSPSTTSNPNSLAGQKRPYEEDQDPDTDIPAGLSDIIYDMEPLTRFGSSSIQYYAATSDYNPANNHQQLPRDSLIPGLTLADIQAHNHAERRKYLGFIRAMCANATREMMHTTMRDELRGLEAFCTHTLYFTTWGENVRGLLLEKYGPETTGDGLWMALTAVQGMYRGQHELLWAKVDDDGHLLTRREADILFFTWICSNVSEHPALRGPVATAKDGREPMLGRLRHFSDVMQRIDRPERMLGTLLERMGDVNLHPAAEVGWHLPLAKWCVFQEMVETLDVIEELIEVSERCGFESIRLLRKLAVELRDLDMALEVYQGTFFEIEQGLEVYPVAVDENGRAIFLQES